MQWEIQEIEYGIQSETISKIIFMDLSKFW